MLSQQKADSELLSVFGKITSIILLLVMLTVFGMRYFDSVDELHGSGLEVEHARLLQILAMVRAQWMSSGRPDEIELNWELIYGKPTDSEEIKSRIALSNTGFPVLKRVDKQNCGYLLTQLLGVDLHATQIVASVNDLGDTCSFTAKNGDRIGYHLDSGHVFFAKSHADE